DAPILLLAVPDRARVRGVRVAVALALRPHLGRRRQLSRPDQSLYGPRRHPDAGNGVDSERAVVGRLEPSDRPAAHLIERSPQAVLAALERIARGFGGGLARA